MRREVDHNKFNGRGGSCRFINGSYYPQEYVSFYQTEESKSRTMAQKFHRAGHGPLEAGSLTIEELASYDVLYAYMWPWQMLPIFEMFQKYAKEDALLIAPKARCVDGAGPIITFGVPTMNLMESGYESITKRNEFGHQTYCKTIDGWDKERTERETKVLST